MNHNNTEELQKLMAIPAQPVKPTKTFLKDLKRLSRSGNYDLDRLKLVIELVRHKVSLSRGYDEHILIYVHNETDIHISSDWVLLYKQLKDKSGPYIMLYRTGPHNWIFK